jgi:O-antigen/teichoic acid export membrane protein
VMVAVTLLLLAVVPFVYRYMINPRYSTALNYYYFIVLGYFVWGITFYFYSFLLYFKHKKKLLFLSVFNIVSTLSCIYFFTSWYGAKGSAMAMLINCLVTLGLTMFFTRKFIGTYLLNIKTEDKNL